MKLGRHGCSKHIANISNKSSLPLKIIKRLDELDAIINVLIVKACALPSLTYPAYTLNAFSKSQMLSLKRIQNRALRFAYREKYPHTKTTEEIYLQSNLEPISPITHKRSNHIKHKLDNILKTHYTTLQ